MEPTTNPNAPATPEILTVPKLNKEQTEFILAMSQIGPVMVAEYRGEGTEVIKYTNKKTGAAEQFTKHGLALEFGPDGAVQQMQADIDYPKDVEPVPTGYTKGQKIIIVISGMIKTRDSITASVSRHRPF